MLPISHANLYAPITIPMHFPVQTLTPEELLSFADEVFGALSLRRKAVVAVHGRSAVSTAGKGHVAHALMRHMHPYGTCST